MRIIIRLLIPLAFSQTLASHTAQQVLTFFVKEQEKQKPLHKIFPGINKELVHRKSVHPKKLFVLYYGYLTIPNEYDQIILPRKTTKTSFQMVIANKIEYVMMFPNTLAHWNIPFNTEMKLIDMELVKKGDHYVWRITNKTPTTRKIPADAIILIAKPKNIVVPLGEFKTTKSNQLVLPDIFIKKDFEDAQHALFMIKISKFFKPISVSFDNENNLISRITV